MEFLKKRRQILNDALQLHLRAMHQMMAFFAIPFEPVPLAVRARHFHHQANRSVSVPLRRMAHMFGQQKDLTFLDRNLDRGLARRFHDPDKNVSLELVEKFFSRIVVIVHALVGPADHRHDHVAIVPDLGVAHGRLQLVAIRINPALKIESLKRFYRRHSSSFTASGRACTQLLSFRSSNEDEVTGAQRPSFGPALLHRKIPRKLDCIRRNRPCSPGKCKFRPNLSNLRSCWPGSREYFQLRHGSVPWISSCTLPSPSGSAPAKELSARRELVPEINR